eukprot:SAG31_NODE_387_length_16403_cov_5.062071_7_plen_351_part_00
MMLTLSLLLVSAPSVSTLGSSTCLSALQASCSDPTEPCGVCSGWRQPALRVAGCSVEEVGAYCAATVPWQSVRSVLTWGGVKVLPAQPLSSVPTPGSDAPFVLSAARNEYEQLQLVVEVGDFRMFSFLGASKVKKCNFLYMVLQGPATVDDVKVAVAGADVRWSVYRVGYLNVTKLTDCYSMAPNGRAPFSAPEHLVPDVDAIDGQRRSAFPIKVPPGELRSIIVDFFMPETHPTGEGCYFLVFVQLFEKYIRDCNREKYRTNRESVALQGIFLRVFVRLLTPRMSSHRTTSRSRFSTRRFRPPPLCGPWSVCGLCQGLCSLTGCPTSAAAGATSTSIAAAGTTPPLLSL